MKEYLHPGKKPISLDARVVPPYSPSKRVVPCLLSLPSEILVQIWGYIPRQDIENMSLVNRRLHLVGEGFIKRHRWMKSRYRRVETRPMPDHPRAAKMRDRDRTLVRIIKEVSGDPIAASYVEEIVVNGYTRNITPGREYEAEKKARRQEAKESIKLLESLIVNNPYLQADIRANLAIVLENIIQEGNEDALIAFLLTLPNIDTVWFRPYTEVPFMALHAVQAIAQDESPTALTRLSKLVIDGEYGCYDLFPLVAFAKIPSLRVCHADQMSDMGYPWSFNWRQEDMVDGISNITELSFTRADIRADLEHGSLHRLLAMLNSLRSFTFEPCDLHDINGEVYDFEPDKICKSLHQYVKHSLRHLRLRGRCRNRKYMGSLRDFAVLADVDTDWGLVRSRTLPSKDQLTAAMPPSIRRLHLTPDPGFIVDVSISAIRHLIATKPLEFPSLEGIHLPLCLARPRWSCYWKLENTIWAFHLNEVLIPISSERHILIPGRYMQKDVLAVPELTWLSDRRLILLLIKSMSSQRRGMARTAASRLLTYFITTSEPTSDDPALGGPQTPYLLHFAITPALSPMKPG